MYISRPILFLATLLVVVLILFTCNHVDPTQVGSKQVDTSSWRNGAGDLVSSVTGKPSAFAMRDKHIADSVAKVYKTRISRLTEYIIANQHSSVNLDPVDSTKETDYFPSIDSCPPQIKNMRQRFINPWYQADVQLGDSPYLHLNRWDTLTVVWKTVHKGWLFNRKTLLQLDLSSADTSNRIYGVQAYRKYIPQKRWGVSVTAGYCITVEKPDNPVPFVGIGISYSLIKF